MVEPDRSCANGEALLRRVALVAGLWTLYSSLYPFDVVVEASTIVERLTAGARVLAVDAFFGHVVVLGGLGACLGLLARAAGRRARGAWSVALVASCLVLELLQAGVATRHACAGDFLLNTAVALAAFHSARALDRRSELLEWLEPRAASLARGLAWLFGASTLALAWAHTRDVSLANWDAGQPLVIGNERTWDRPFLGSIEGLALYRSALEPDAARELAELPFDTQPGHARRRARGAAASYAFTEDGSGRIVGAGDAAPTLTVEPRIVPAASRAMPRGLALTSERRVLVAEDSSELTRLTRALARDSSFAIEVRCATSGLDQTGPARIVSLSRDPMQRNVTLAQLEDRLVLRVRSPLNGTNGTGVEGVWPGVFVDEGSHHLVVSYDRGRMTAAVDGERLAPDVHVDRPVPGWTWNPMQLPWLAACLLLVPIGLFAGLGWGWGARGERVLVVAIGAAVVLAAVDGLASLRFDATPDLRFALLALLFVPLAALAGSATFGDSRRAKR